MLHRLLPVLATAMLAGGCASLVDGQNQSVSVLTPDCPGAACRLHNDKGRWYVATTPASVVVNRSFADLVVNCSKDTAPPVMKAFPSATKGMAYGNILLGGVIGAGVDVINGAAYDYPQELSVPLDCRPVAGGGSPRLGCRVQDVADPAGATPGRPGVRVTWVDPGSAAELAGLRVGDILLEFNGQAIADSEALKQLLASQDPQKVFRVRYARGGVQADAVFMVKGGGS